MHFQKNDMFDCTEMSYMGHMKYYLEKLKKHSFLSGLVSEKASIKVAIKNEKIFNVEKYILGAVEIFIFF